jgi:trehalose 6-phosphate phosphatase
MELPTDRARQRYADLVAASSGAVIGLDFDGVLSPIVDDPTQARIHPDAPDILVGLAGVVRAVAVVTGRPAAQAIELGGLDGVAERIAEHGGALYLMGQYGNERWSSLQPAVVSPPPPAGLERLLAELPALLATADAQDAYVEEKGLAVAVHTRRLPDPQGALDRLTPVLAEAAARHGLGVEPGRLVIELRAPGMHKGEAVSVLAAELDARGFLFAGDDLGDVEAFQAVARLRDEGLAGFLVCSGSEEQKALVELADVVVDGPDGVMGLLRRLTADASRSA